LINGKNTFVFSGLGARSISVWAGALRPFSRARGNIHMADGIRTTRRSIAYGFAGESCDINHSKPATYIYCPNVC
jgi:hypothetical protein